MSPGDRCDNILRLIDEALADLDGPAELPTEQPGGDRSLREEGVEELPGHWGVYYLRPSA